VITVQDDAGAGLAARLRRSRLQAGLSQRDVAERLNRSQSAVSRWERGRGRPSSVELERLEHLLGVDLMPNLDKVLALLKLAVEELERLRLR
jgi:transcriptional regulator with XRE-family HTH domain